MAQNISRTSNLSLPDAVQTLEQRLVQVEERFSEMGYGIKSLVQSEVSTNWHTYAQAETIYGMHTAICIDTIDIFKQGRVRYFSPLQHSPNSPVKSLPWAWPISNQGGFDDCGCTWVPPAGSKLCLIFEAGNRQWPYYMGTTWDRDRSGGWDIPVPEYEKIHRGHRGGYLLGPQETQVFPPWNTENYNGLDIDSVTEFESDPEAKNKITYPNIYGWKTPQKHMIKMVDGNYKCNFRWQRLEIKSAQGNHLIFKDDRIHPAAQWAHPDCPCGSGDLTKCNEGDEPIEKVDTCPTQTSGDATPVAPDVMMVGSGRDSAPKGGGTSEGQCANPYFKHRSECRPYSGPGNPQNNKVDKTTLPQSGIQMTSLSGHTFWMDDAVGEPRGKNNWEKGVQPFDYGCDDVFKGKTVWKSAHGHQIVMSDVEPDGFPKERNSQNFIRILTATGNRIELNDDTKVGSCRAGSRRGIELHSTSNHIIQMIDENNDHCNKNRREGMVPDNKATDAFVRIRTGYGLEIMMADNNHQEDTQTQYLQLMAPQYDACEKKAGPHLIRMQESDDCGYIWIRAAGDYVCHTIGDHVTIVGTGGKEYARDVEPDFCDGGCKGPRNWFTAVSKHSVHYSCNFYFNKSEVAAFLADKIILLLAGKDCPPPPDSETMECGPCVGRVAVLVGDPETGAARLVASDRVFASASLEAPCITQFMLGPNARCGGENCPPPYIGNEPSSSNGGQAT